MDGRDILARRLLDISVAGRGGARGHGARGQAPNLINLILMAMIMVSFVKLIKLGV